MTSRRKNLLNRYRGKKRVVLVIPACLLAAVVGFFVGAGWVALAIFLSWIVREVWLSNRISYRPDADYVYRFDEQLEALPVDFSDGRLRLASGAMPNADDTLILAITVCSTWAGRLFDPDVMIEAEGEASDCQTFERGAKGMRYLNLTGFAGALRGEGVRLRGRHCCLQDTPQLWRAAHPDFRQKRLLIVAPHADDAELAAFGLYSQARESWIVTLTAGEIKTKHYRRMGFDSVEAARIKGRLRSWDSMAVPLWAGVPIERTVQLGYFCMQLPAMRLSPAEAVASQEAALADTRFFRAFNRIKLESDRDGVPSWNNLVADLREIILLAKPELIVLPHPLIDPHSDHVAADEAVREALVDLAWQPEVLLHYANHIRGTDQWPMGKTHSGVALPPLFKSVGTLVPWVLSLDRSRQIDKAMALGMMHDLTTPLSSVERRRRVLRRVFAGRQYSLYGSADYFRRAVRRHELFWVERMNSKNPAG
ncbi:MAG: PIG-L family deacetylase [Betaproteobacteria bacterium]|nr:PIG-L family deacetylase [Betaproteobacteria bacterium]